MSDIQREMQEVKSEQAVRSQAAEVEGRNQAEKEQVEQEIQDFLNQLVKEFLAGDDKLYLDEGLSGVVGFTIGYPLVWGWTLKKFSVSAVYSQGKLEVTAADGKWEQLPNVMGNWADWADSKTVYSGPVDKEKLQKVIQQQFMVWYRSVTDGKIQ